MFIQASDGRDYISWPTKVTQDEYKQLSDTNTEIKPPVDRCHTGLWGEANRLTANTIRHGPSHQKPSNKWKRPSKGQDLPMCHPYTSIPRAQNKRGSIWHERREERTASGPAMKRPVGKED